MMTNEPVTVKIKPGQEYFTPLYTNQMQVIQIKPGNLSIPNANVSRID